jgi:hypothetical protein
MKRKVLLLVILTIIFTMMISAAGAATNSLAAEAAAVVYFPITLKHIDISDHHITMDQALTTDYWGSPKTIFKPGEAIRLSFIATNHSDATVQVTYQWSTYDPDGKKVDYFSWTKYDLLMPPGEDSWYLERWIPANSTFGRYSFTASVTYRTRTDQKTTTFIVEDPLTP